MNIRDWMQQHIVYLDGGMGTLLQAAGMQAGELPERRNLTHPEDIVSIHKAYFDAGANIVNTNTFGANTIKYSHEELERIIPAAISLARRAAEESIGTQPKLVALDIGPSGRLIAPYGDLSFDQAVEIFATTVRIGAACGVDLIMIETMSDSLETKAALLAAKENCDLPVFVSNAYGGDGRLMTGADPETMIALLEGLGADAIGINCSLGPEQMAAVVEQYLSMASVPVLVKPNAGLPRSENGVSYYDVLPDAFSERMKAFVQKGARIVGGCCGTTPAYIQALHDATADILPAAPTGQTRCVVSSYNHARVLGNTPVLVGQCINPQNAAVREALKASDIESLVDEAFEDIAEGAQVLKVNVAVDGLDQRTLLPATVRELQTVINVPLWLQTDDPTALERALRLYNGKAMVSSITPNAWPQLLPIVKKYGAVIALCEAGENTFTCAIENGILPRDLLRINEDTITYVS